MAWTDHLPGGLADAKKPEDFSAGALRKGKKVELEHTNRRPLATEIAMDHLTEDPKYYEKLEKVEKKAFSTSAYSGPLNPVIHSGASYQPPRKMPQLRSAIQKTAELWPGFFEEMMKWAADAGVGGGGVNVGQWWEQVGGPHLAKGGDHGQFKKMMEEAGLPEGVQKKFMNVAKEKYSPKAQPRWTPYESTWTGPGPEPPNPNYKGRYTRAGWMPRPPSAREVAEELAGQYARNPMQWAPGLAALGVVGGAARLNKEKEDAPQASSALRGRLGAHMTTTVPLGLIGYNLGSNIAPLSRYTYRAAPLVGAGLGSVLGALTGEKLFRSQEEGAKSHVDRALREGRTDKQRARALSRMKEDARKTTAETTRNIASPTALPALALAGLQGPHALGTTAGSLASIAQGTSLLEQYRRRKAYELAQEKAAAGAPTRGNFMMASDVPAFRAPRLDRAIQKDSCFNKEKDGDMLPDFVTYRPGDFKRSKYAMPLEELSAFVSELLEKDADVSPARSWSGGIGHRHRQESDVPPFRAPRLDRAIQKEGAVASPAGQLAKAQRVGAPKATAPPGPSIADIAKPRGAKFGIGTPGSFKTTL